MTALAEQTADARRLQDIVLRAVDEVGATLSTALVVMGDRLGLYRALAGAGPLSAAQVAERAGASERYVREWLNAQAAGGYVEYEPDSGRYALSAEAATALADESSPAYLPGLFQLALGAVVDSPRVVEAARTGAGIARETRASDVREGCDRFSRTSYSAHLVSGWLPALEGVLEKLKRGARVADVGCGRGGSTILLAEAFPASRFEGYDGVADSIETARRRARAAGVDGRVDFRVAPAASYSGHGYDLVMMLDCLHELGDPAAAARHVRRSLAPDGTWMIVEPKAGDRVEENLNPVGRAYYALSTLLSTPASLADETGLALGAQAGEARIREIVTGAGFSSFRRVAETPLAMVFEARP